MSSTVFENAEIRPLVLVVDDQPGSLRNRVRGLREAGCQTIAVPSRSSALSSLRDGPAVDLIVTDIHLGNSDPRGGVALAVGVKAHYDFDLPIAAYSGKVTDEDLEDVVPEGIFTISRQRGNQNVAQMRAFNEQCKTLALEHRDSRVQRAKNRARLSASTTGPLAPVESKAFELIGIDELEEAIVGQGYTLRLISSDSFKELAATVPIWIRQTSEKVEVQVCGQPYLHWEANDEESALVGLVSSMDAYAKYLASAPEPLEQGGLERLKQFLEIVVRVDDADEKA